MKKPEIEDINDHLNGVETDFSNKAYNLAMKIKTTSPKTYAIIAKKKIDLPYDLEQIYNLSRIKFILAMHIAMILYKISGEI